MNALEAQQLLAEKSDIQVLDVRTKGEFNKGHIEGAIRINYYNLRFKKKLRELDRDSFYLVYCKSGHRSGNTIRLMQQEGFTKIYHFDGGYDAWNTLQD